MDKIISKIELQFILKQAFKEDLDKRGDITSISTIPESETGYAKFILKAAGVVAGLPIFEPIYKYIDPGVKINIFAEDGQSLPSGFVIAELEGSLRNLLIGERTALNFLQRLSGIASISKQYVDRISHTKAKILDTRKTTPGLRVLEKYAVRQGGAFSHRTGLFDRVLIKDNHIDANGGIGPAITRCLEYLNKENLSVPIEVETRSLKEVKEALCFPIQRIMLDNMSIAMMIKSVQLIHGRVETEASGNISLDNVKEVAETGVDFISVGALTHSVKALDISMYITKK